MECQNAVSEVCLGRCFVFVAAYCAVGFRLRLQPVDGKTRPKATIRKNVAVSYNSPKLTFIEHCQASSVLLNVQ